MNDNTPGTQATGTVSLNVVAAPTAKSKRYWVEAVDGDDIGDYGGFQFHSWYEAVDWVESFYADELATVGGDYEWEDEIQRLQIVVLTVESIRDMPPRG
ncbi:MAG: hypothetical protein P1T08_12875 [Acidimicrobiia bacterium]|nr:hypothetical protein [Acidimicrobiia bacterium]